MENYIQRLTTLSEYGMVLVKDPEIKALTMLMHDLKRLKDVDDTYQPHITRYKRIVESVHASLSRRRSERYIELYGIPGGVKQ